MISEVSNTASLVHAWPQVEPMIDEALAHGEGDIAETQDILRSVMAGKSSMYVVHDDDRKIAAVMVLSLLEGKIRKMRVDVLAGSDWDAWIDPLEQVLVSVSEHVDAVCIDASCRIGLAKKLAARGWGKKAIVMSKQL